MVATRRRHQQALKEDSRSPTPELKDKEDATAALIAACVDVLSATYPKGMTSKELAAKLEDAKAFPVSISSPVLSSKLNAIFRKLHGDSSSPSEQQLRLLPIRRDTSTDLPKRLVYTLYKPSKAEEPVTPPAEDDDEPLTKRRRLSRRRGNDSTTLTPPETNSPVDSDPAPAVITNE